MHIIGIAGKKQSGKNTLGNFITGHILTQNQVIDRFEINELGELVVNCTFVDGDKVKHDMGVLDLNQRTPQFFDYASNRIWPYVKTYSFSDALKEVCVDILGLKPEQAYGTDAQKNSETHLKWEDMPVVMPYAGPMTARQVLQFVGTEIFRKMYTNVWTDFTIKQIKSEQPALAIVTDCRFPNEVEAIQKVGGKVVHLTRDISTDSHASETSLDEFTGYDHTINNQNMTIKESCDAFLEWCIDQSITSYIHKPTFRKIK